MERHVSLKHLIIWIMKPRRVLVIQAIIGCFGVWNSPRREFAPPAPARAPRTAAGPRRYAGACAGAAPARASCAGRERRKRRASELSLEQKNMHLFVVKRYFRYEQCAFPMSLRKHA